MASTRYTQISQAPLTSGNVASACSGSYPLKKTIKLIHADRMNKTHQKGFSHRNREARPAIPFLIYEEKEDGTTEQPCTSCGICAKVCPPQCIWIVRANDPNTGRPIPDPAEFYIDIDICMSCGLCSEYCPFDAIKMDHNYELATYERKTSNIFDKEKLSKPVSYYASIRPKNFANEEAAKLQAEALRAARKAKAGA